MRQEYRLRWQREIERRAEPLKTPRDLLRRALSSEDFVDAAVIGGVGIADILTGKVAEWQIPSDVIEAFHAQYPQHGATFVEAVNDLSSKPDELAGLISGIKGKLFEIDYVDWLNDGHLPSGWTAELAQTANNPGWDIAIHDRLGHVAELLQLKATESVAYVKEAIAAHPDIDVVVPHDIYERLSDHPELFGHIVDGHQSATDLTGQVSSAAEHADGVGDQIHFPVVAPILAVGFATHQNWKRYRAGRITLNQMLQNVGERSLLAVIATGTGWAVGALCDATGVGIPVSMSVRLFGRQLLHNRDRRKLLTTYIEAITASTSNLQGQISRPVLEGSTG
jgi:hypothetical protein